MLPEQEALLGRAAAEIRDIPGSDFELVTKSRICDPKLFIVMGEGGRQDKLGCTHDKTSLFTDAIRSTQTPNTHMVTALSVIVKLAIKRNSSKASLFTSIYTINISNIAQINHIPASKNYFLLLFILNHLFSRLQTAISRFRPSEQTLPVTGRGRTGRLARKARYGAQLSDIRRSRQSGRHRLNVPVCHLNVPAHRDKLRIFDSGFRISDSEP
ncbi:hypothetical protein [Shinella zoogloeoides]|uniref:hypothetical protein n=1 Tax=Shinella zoogloeoides TaxID=352475 RepID=UPI001F56EC92|nr:hypothetical protein [Shinella zoogloeoides]